MTYLDPMRFALSGDQARAQQHVRTARNVAYQLVKLNSEGGALSGRRRLNLADGTTIEVVHAGNDVSAKIDAPTGGKVRAATVAYVAVLDSTPRVLIVDVDTQEVLENITGLGNVVSLAAHPNDKFLFALNNNGQIIRVDLTNITAIGVTYSGTPFTDMFMSNDYQRLYARFAATGTPGAGGTYGGVLVFDTAELALVGTFPNALWSSRTYRGDDHPALDELLYLPVFGDGDLDGNPVTGNNGPNYAPEAVEVWNRLTNTAVAGDTFHPYQIASGRGLRELVINRAGTRAFACSSRARTNVVTPVSTLVVYDVTDGALIRVSDHFVDSDLTGCVAVSSDGNTVYVAEADSNLARTLVLDNGAWAEGPAFPCRADAVPEGPTSRMILSGPRDAQLPDKRVFFLSYASRSLWAFKPGTTEPHRQIVFALIPTTFVLKRVRRFIS